MKFTTISQTFFDNYSFDGDELTHNKDEKRPYVIVVKLNFRGAKHNFALPFRSHIKSYVDSNQYFKLPPNHTTKNGEIHGLHYIKMFPIEKKYLQKYRFKNDKLSIAVQNKIRNNIKQIVTEAQEYLNNYETGSKPPYCVDIDGIIEGMSKADVEK